MKERTLRIVAGAWRNRRLVIVAGSRPTAERAREAFFDILGDRIVGARVLELYAGSGAIAIEALSRGAARAVAVDRDTRALERNRRTLAADLADMGFPAGSEPLEILRAPAREALRELALRPDRFDLVFLDPPYEAQDSISAGALVPLLARGGRVAWQSDADTEVNAWPLRVARRASYGRNVFTFLEAP